MSTYDVSQLPAMPLPLQDTDIAGMSRGGTTKNATLANWGVYFLAKIQSLLAAIGIQLGSTGIGYAGTVGAGGAVTQLTSYSTGVTLSTLCGQVTMYTSMSLAAGAEAIFTVTNTQIGAQDGAVVWIVSSGAGTPAASILSVNGSGGSFQICVTNLHASTAATSVVVGFAVFKSAIS